DAQHRGVCPRPAPGCDELVVTAHVNPGLVDPDGQAVVRRGHGGRAAGELPHADGVAAVVAHLGVVVAAHGGGTADGVEDGDGDVIAAHRLAVHVGRLLDGGGLQ